MPIRRGAKGTDLGGQFVGAKSVARALIKMMSPDDAAKHDAEVKARTPKVGMPAIGRLMAASTPAQKKMAARDRHSAGQMSDRIRTLDEQHAARPVAGSRMSRPEERRANRMLAEHLRGELAPVQRRVDTADAIDAEHKAMYGPVPELGNDADLLAAARAKVAEMQRQAAPASSDWADSLSRADFDELDRLDITQQRSYEDMRSQGLDHEAALKRAAPSTSDAREIEVENRIRGAYRDLSQSQGLFVELADLREHHKFRDLPRAEQDAALLRLRNNPDVRLYPHHQKILTPRDRASALDIGFGVGGREGAHTISFSDQSPRPLPSTPDARAAAPAAAPNFDSAPTVGYEARPMGDGSWGTYALAGNGGDLLVQRHDSEGAARERAGTLHDYVVAAGGQSPPMIARARAGGGLGPLTKAAPAKKTAAKAQPKAPRKLTTKDLEYKNAEEVQQAYEEGRVSPTLAARRMRQHAEEMRQWVAHGRMGSTMGHGVVGGNEPSSPELVANLQHRVDLAAKYDRMATEIEAKSPKTAAAKMTRAKAAAPAAHDVRARLDSVRSTGEATAYIGSLNLTLAGLRELAADLRVPLAQRTKAGITADIVKVVVSGRLTTEVVHRF